MQSIRSPMAAVDPKPQRKAKAHFRKPLQPKNFNCRNTPPTQEKHKPTKIFPPLLSIEDGKADKENRRIGVGGGWFIDTSLAEELVTIRRKMERLREERERTERALREKDLRLEKAMAEMEMRWTEQRPVQKEMDRIRRLKDSCTRIPPFTSLRENEREKKIKEAQFQQHQVEKENEKTEETEDKAAEPTMLGESSSAL